MRKILVAFFVGMISLVGMAQTISTFPHTEDFESFNTCSTTSGSSCALSNGWSNPATGDDIDWTTDNGGTGSSPTGPPMDYNPGTSTGKYLYIEASTSGTGYPSKTAHLVSPLIDPTAVGNLKLTFWYHMFGSSMGSMHIDISTDGGTTWTNDIVPSWTDNQDLWQMKEVNLSAWSNATFHFRIRGITGANYYSDMAVDNFILNLITGDDAGIDDISSPSMPLSAGMQNVDVLLKNFGQDTLATCTINWSVNGVAQAPYSFAGSLLYEDTTTVAIGSFNFVPGNYDICAWTSNPNGVVDENANNDSSCVYVCTAMPAGIYTIGAGGNFPDFTAAVMQLDCGIQGPVEFQVMPGTYAEAIHLIEVMGASVSNTITFNGMDAALVTLINDSSQNATVEVEGADYFIFKNITVRNPMATVDSWGFHFRQMANYNTIDSCRIIMEHASGIADVIGIVASGSLTDDYNEGENVNFLTISNNEIQGGEMGIHLEGDGSVWMKGNMIIHNHIHGMDDYGMYLDNSDSLFIIGNTINDLQAAGGDGIYCYDVLNFYISENNIIAQDYGMYIADGNYNLDGTPSGRSYIINNMVYSSSDYAGYFDDFEETDIFHNTFSGKPGLRLNDIINLDIRNNIFFSETDYAFEIDDAITTAVIDYNIYYTPASNTNFVDIGTSVYADLAAWQTAAPTLNANSIEEDPAFNAVDDLHVLSALVNDLGDNTLGITVDIDGDARPMSPSTTVDMGADEFTPLALDIMTKELFTDVSGCGDSNTMVSLVIKSQGAVSTTGFPLTVEVLSPYTQTMTVTYTDTLDFNETDTVLMGSINTVLGGPFMMQAYSALSGDGRPYNDTINAGFIWGPIIAPTGSAASSNVCYGDSTYLVGDGNGQLAWYNSLSGGNMLSAGDTLWTGPLMNDTTYYVGFFSGGVDSLETTYAAGNGCGNGNMFDVTAINTLSLDSLAGSFASTGNQTVSVYYIPNATYSGNEQTATAWTLWFSRSINIATVGKNYIADSAQTSLLINAGETYAIYVDYNCDYTSGANTYTNNDMIIDAGVGLCASFGSVNNPRTFNGALYYSMDPCTFERTPVDIMIDPLAIAGFSYTESELVLTLTDTSAHADSVMYDYGDGNTGSQSIYTYAAQGTYYVCQVAYNSCGTDTICDSVTITCTMPEAGFSTVINVGDVTFTDTSADADSLLYDFGDGNTSTLSNPMHTYAANGVYTVCQTVYNHCGVDSVCRNIDIVGIGIPENSLLSAFSIFPNPNSGDFTIALELAETSSISLEIFNSIGELMSSEHHRDVSGKLSYDMNLNKLQNGIYFVRLTVDDVVMTKKLIIQ